MRALAQEISARKTHIAWSIVIAIVGYGAWALISGGEKVWTAFGKVGIQGFAVVCLLSLANYGLRFMRWELLLGTKSRAVPIQQNLIIYLSGFTFSTTPGKAGEAVRSLFLFQWGVPYSKSLSALFAERLSDLISIVLIAAMGLVLFPQYSAMIVAVVLLCLALLVLATFASAQSMLRNFLARWKKHRWVQTLLDSMDKFLSASMVMNKPSMLISGLAIGFVAWGAEAISLAIIVDLLGYDLPYLTISAVYALGILAGAISLMPGGLGGTEIVVAALLMSLGLDSADAAAATLISRITTLWFAVLIGALMLPFANQDTNQEATNNE